MKKLLLLFTGIVFSMSTMASTDSLWVKGLVTNIVNGAPIPHHTVAIEIDSSTNWFFTYFKNTDSTGRYASHIPLNGPTGYIKIYVWDCNNVKHKVTRYYNINSTDTLYQDFQICDSLTPCHAFYSDSADLYNPQIIHFQDLSAGNILSWHWDFGDPAAGTNNTSTLQNPAHYYIFPGYYTVCLTIQGTDSLCFDTYCYNILVDSNTGYCHAAFTYYRDSLTTDYKYHFIDQSTGNITSWDWNFGDGQSSSDQNPIHTYALPGIYVVHLYISNSDSTCNDNRFDTLIVGNGSGCQAIFTFYSTAPATDQIVHFKDGSTGNPTHWLWNFDDPDSGPLNVSYLQDADHVFASPGTHNVCLTISGDSCSSTVCHHVLIPDSVNYHQVYGQVFGGNFPFHGGFVMLMSQHNVPNRVPYMDDSSIDSNGVYIFNQVPDGRYVIFAEDYNLQEVYLRTWYQDTFMWDEATEIELGEPSNPYNIHLVPLGSPVPGPGLISGQINYEILPYQGLTMITMILMDLHMKPIALCPVSASGQFVFPSLAYGTYYLHPENQGFYGDIVKVEITEAKPHGEVVMTLTEHQILGTGNLPTRTENVMIYPNPVTDQLTISVNLMTAGKISIDVFAINGQLILSRTENVNSGISTITLPFSALNEGMYIVKIQSEDGINVVRRVVKTR